MGLEGHCLTSGSQDDELQRFDELARWAAIYLGHADLKGEAARDFLGVLLRDYFMDQTSDRQKVGLVGHDKEATIEFPFKAAKIYFGVLANLAPVKKATGEPRQTEELDWWEDEVTYRAGHTITDTAHILNVEISTNSRGTTSQFTVIVTSSPHWG
ncbi:MAG: hypothetical protein O6949_07925 [Chloroflexi bacterium]|nr:hypothetical protein [Chloroflexota bacterium]